MRKVVLILIIGTHLLLLSRLIFFPYPELFIYSYLTDKGLLPYKQIFDQHFPGLMFFPVNLYTLGMTNPQVARIWHFGIVSVTHILLFSVARTLFKSEKWALFTNSLYLLWQPFFEGYVLWIDTFVPIFLLSAFYFLFQWKNREKSKFLFWSGFLLGITLLLKQVTAPLIAVVGLLLLWKMRKFKKIKPFVVGVLLPLIFLVVYIFAIGVFQDFIYWTVTFNLTTFAQMGRKYPDFSGLARALPVFGLAGIAVLFYYYKRKSLNILLLGAFFFASLAYAYARFDYIHLQPALPFALLILTYSLVRIPKRLFKIVILGFLAISAFLILPFYRINSGSRVLFFGELERGIATRVEELTEPSDKVFAFGTTPHLYQITNRLPPGNIFVFQFPWFMVVAENMVLSGIINDPPKLVVRDKSATTGGEYLVNYMPNINQFIDENYQLVDKVDGIEVMLKR